VPLFEGPRGGLGSAIAGSQRHSILEWIKALISAGDQQIDGMQ
jgi:hypothetical protein